MDKNKEIKDFQMQQKHIGSNYYSLAGNCTNPNLKNDFLSFAREESNIIDWLSHECDGEQSEPVLISPEERKNAYNMYNIFEY